MEESVKEHPTPTASALAKSKLRYPLRSASKSKDEKPPVADLPPSSSASKRGRQASSVSKSVSLLDLSRKDKSSSSASISRPSRRLSVPARSATGKPPIGSGTVTPISEVRMKRQSITSANSETPLSNVSRASASRRKFSVLSSASYWLSQIKLSESAAKHSVSLGFFKLALDAGCQPLQRMRDELKSYVSRHELDENGEVVKELLEKYHGLGPGNEEQMQVSETVSQVPEEGTRSSDDDVRSSSSAVGTRNLRPRSPNTNAANVSAVKDLADKAAASRTRGPANKGSADTKPASDAGGRRVQKKPQQPTKQVAPTFKDKVSRQGKKSPSNKGPACPRDCPEEDKENVVDPQAEETRLVEAI